MEKKYNYLLTEGAPALLVSMLKEYGITEIVGAKHNPRIVEYFKTIGWGHIKDDETPWCGALVGFCAKQVGLSIPATALRATSWTTWGDKVDTAMLGDVLVFNRNGGGHVGLYVGEDASYYHVLGGNQSNQVNITRIAKTRCSAIRRTKWKIAQPKNVRVINLSPTGIISTNEA